MFRADVRGEPNNLAFVAFRDGDGDWVPLSGDAGVYPFAPSGERYGLLWACPRAVTNVGSTSIFVTYRTLAEDDAPQGHCDGPMPSERFSLSGNVTAESGSMEIWAYSMGYGHQGGGGPSYDFDALPAGTYDLGVRNDLANPSGYRFALRRAIEITADRVVDIDLASEGFEFEEHPLTVTGAENPGVSAIFIAEDSGLRLAPGVIPPGTWTAVPGDQLRARDLHSVAAILEDRSVTRYVHEPGPLALVLPDSGIGPVDVEVITTEPYPRVRAELMASDAQLYSFRWTSRPTAGATIGWLIEVTAGWLDGDESVVLETPGLSGLNGWSDRWVETTEPASWEARATSKNNGVESLLAEEIADGDEVSSRRAEGQLAL